MADPHPARRATITPAPFTIVTDSPAADGHAQPAVPLGLSVIVPCYNEAREVLQETIDAIKASLEPLAGECPYEVIVVNDGSKKYNYDDLAAPRVRIVNHRINKGYGGALKTGIRVSRYAWVGITDADGTYPNARFHEFVQAADGYDMVVGARSWKDISALRRGPKYVLTGFASFLADYPIQDLNSGMRIFRKEVAKEFWRLYPNGFSFTSTITMGCVTNGYAVRYLPIDYYKRQGKSYINPIKDTVLFFTLVTRLTLYFKPLRFFLPLSLFSLVGAVARGLRDYQLVGGFGGLTLILFFMAFQVFFFGLLAEIISKINRTQADF